MLEGFIMKRKSPHQIVEDFAIRIYMMVTVYVMLCYVYVVMLFISGVPHISYNENRGKQLKINYNLF